MDKAVFLSLQYEGRVKLIVADNTTTFDHLLQQTKGEWVSLNSNDIYYTSTVGSLENISLKCDQDLANLLMFCDHLQEKLATVKITCRNSGGNELNVSKKRKQPNDDNYFGGHTPPLAKPKRTTLGNGDEFSGLASIPSYGMSPEVEPKTLLSEGWQNLIRGKGQTFKGGAEEFRNHVAKYTSKLGFRYDFQRNDARYVHVVCTERVDHECPWFIKAGRQSWNNYFVINNAHLVHNCVGKLSSNKKSRLGAAILGALFTDSIRQDPTVGYKLVKSAIKTSYGLDVSYSRAHRTAEYSKKQIFGTYVESFNHLPWYSETVESTNPGSFTRLEAEPGSNRFKRIFIAFNALLEGFKSCRPMLFIDGTYMSGRTKGTVLAATAKDGNNGLYPVAFAVVSCENLENWKWFLELLRDKVKHQKEIFYISDRHTGLMSAFPKVFDKPVHFF